MDEEKSTVKLNTNVRLFRLWLGLALLAVLALSMVVAIPAAEAQAPTSFQKAWAFELTSTSGQGITFINRSQFANTISVTIYPPGGGAALMSQSVQLAGYQSRTYFPGQTDHTGWSLPVRGHSSPGSDQAYGFVATGTEYFSVMLYPDELKSGWGGGGKTAIWAQNTLTDAWWGHYNYPAEAANTNAREYFFVFNPSATQTANLSVSLFKSDGSDLGTNPRSLSVGPLQTRTVFLESDLNSSPNSPSPPDPSVAGPHQNISVHLLSDAPVNASIYTTLGSDWDKDALRWKKHDQAAGIYLPYEDDCLRGLYTWAQHGNGAATVAARVTNPNAYPITVRQTFWTVDGSPANYVKETAIPARGTAELPAPDAYDPGWKDEATAGKKRVWYTVESIDDPGNPDDAVGSFHAHVSYEGQIALAAPYSTDWWWGAYQSSATDELFMINPHSSSLTVNVEYAAGGGPLQPGQTGGTPVSIAATRAFEWQIPSNFGPGMSQPSVPSVVDGTLHYYSATAFPLHLELTFPGPYGDLCPYDCGEGAGEDFGDAPDTTAGTGPGNYQTLEQHHGPQHVVTSQLYMGQTVDIEGNGQPNIPADGDDINPAAGPDDEDGVDVSDLILTAGQTPAVDVVVYNNSGSTATVVGWIDYNGNGLFEIGERASATAASTGLAQTIVLTFPAVPDGTMGITYARFRISTDADKVMQPTGWARNGEVEDYQVLVGPTDWGDLPDDTAGYPSYPTLLVNNGPRHIIAGPMLGLTIDPESDGQPEAHAQGDDYGDTDGDDEDGVCFCAAPVLWGTSPQVDVEVSAHACFVNGWVDFGGDGGFGETVDQILADRHLAAGTIHLPTFSVPSAPAGDPWLVTYARFRCSTVDQATGGYTQSGAAPDGEVEDYELVVNDIPVEFGDLPDLYGTTLGQAGAYHFVQEGFYLGYSADGEGNGNPTAGADGDDVCGVAPGPPQGDDEDGVTLPASLNPGGDSCVEVWLTNTSTSVPPRVGILDAWMDFGADGWDLPGDRIIDGFELAAGSNYICFPVPDYGQGLAPTGSTIYARFRLTEKNPGLVNTMGPAAIGGIDDPTGPGGIGEVEDYRLESPTAVTVASFTAGQAGEAVLVEWQTATEIDNQGFNLVRAEVEGGARTKLNEGLIPTKMPPGSPVGAAYEFVDESTEPGVAYDYWLEAVDVYGQVETYGPVSAGVLTLVIDPGLWIMPEGASEPGE